MTNPNYDNPITITPEQIQRGLAILNNLYFALNKVYVEYKNLNQVKKDPRISSLLSALVDMCPQEHKAASALGALKRDAW